MQVCVCTTTRPMSLSASHLPGQAGPRDFSGCADMHGCRALSLVRIASMSVGTAELSGSSIKAGLASLPFLSDSVGSGGTPICISNSVFGTAAEKKIPMT